MDSIFLASSDQNTISSLLSIFEDTFQVKLDIYNDGVSAMNALQNKLYACIIIDTRLSGIDGYELIEFLHSKKLIKTQPVIVLIEDLTEEKKQQLINMGCDELISKPFDKIPTAKRIHNELMYSTLRRNVVDYEQKNETDPMTGLLNKEVFQINVRRLLKRGNFGAMIALDMDNIQFVNEFFSHQEGDRMIQGFAQCLQKTMPKNSLISHISGDRFCAFIPNVTAQSDIEGICNNLLKNVEENLKIADSSRQISASIGIAICPTAATTYDNLMTKANHALLFVKNHGKAGLKFHKPRDDRDEMLKGKQEITFEHISTMLRPRKTEEIQTWLKFGEFRVVYTSFIRYGIGNPASSLTLLNIVNIDRSSKPDFNKVVSMNQKITTFIREAQYPGIYSWYSINQLLVLDIKNQNINRAITNLKAEISEEMKFLGLDLDVFNKTRIDSSAGDKKNRTDF